MALVSATVLSIPQTSESSPTIERRSANWIPSLWDSDFFKTLTNEYSVEEYVKRSNFLKTKVRHLLVHLREETSSKIVLLELMDDIQRLGLGYIFKDDIRQVLGFLFKVEEDIYLNEGLHAKALFFRLCRQHGFNVSQDIFKIVWNPEDVKDILSLYEASHLGLQGEHIMDEAKTFALRCLIDAKEGISDPKLSELVTHALKFPLHHNMTRLEARWYIDAYTKRNDKNLSLLELAKLDYNFVQATYKEELAGLSRWWGNLGLGKRLSFARDRLVESFLWGVGTAEEPKYKYCREGIAKIIALMTVIDDVYDVYATVDEAEQFTEAVMRWDITVVEQLPGYMKLIFFAVYNTVNEFAYNTLKKHGFNILPYLHKQWVNQLNSYLTELKWFSIGYIPTLEEYLKNACISIISPLLSLHMYTFITPEIASKTLDYIESYPRLVHVTAMILRLVDDLATSQVEVERGDVPKAIQCYMKEAGVTEEVARQYIRKLCEEMWKKTNAELWVDSPIPENLRNCLLNAIRTGEIFYGNGDGHGIPDGETKRRVRSLLVDVVPM